ncbi:uncharacterized protein LOC133186506 [Saccostrea echinata]|uniref:uncharacterized protein LOC133186506 n=1 Tax=Saccostrea echinata TaxID=191078 RepID=UPI002A824DEE|nr:uncharacterized protein LOC133186506 [Saccostrea echinata]
MTHSFHVKVPSAWRKNSGYLFLTDLVNINISNIAEETKHVSDLAIVLRNNKTLALIGKWGSGKRTLAVQIALEMEKVLNDKFKFKVIHNFDETCGPSISGLSQPTVIILPDLYKFWRTDQHSEDVINTLIRIRSITKDRKLYIVATFTENAWESFAEYFPNKNVDDLFPRRMSINLSPKTLSEIGRKNQVVLKEAAIKELLCVRGVLGKPLITFLFCKYPVYRNPQFLRLPLFSILSELRRMRNSSDDRKKFRVLEYTMLHGGEVEIEKLENDIDHPLFDVINNVDDRKAYISDYITQLLNGYMEKTKKSYRILHDVITKCVFLVAAEREPEIMFKECDCFLLFDRIRQKSRMEKIWERGKFSCDDNSLTMGIPTESFPIVVKAFKHRKEIMPMLRNVKLFNDIDFQRVWNKIQ